MKLHACPTDDADIRKRKSYFLKKISETCWMVFFWKDVLRVENMKDVGHIDEKEIENGQYLDPTPT
jgi:hypothetical protein